MADRTTDADALDELAERVEKAEGPDRELDAAIADAIGWWPADYTRVDVSGPDRRWRDWKGAGGNRLSDPIDARAYTASLDAALTLVPEGWHDTVYGPGVMAADDLCFAFLDPPEYDRPSQEAEATTRPLALTAAALRARATLARSVQS